MSDDQPSFAGGTCAIPVELAVYEKSRVQNLEREHRERKYLEKSMFDLQYPKVVFQETIKRYPKTLKYSRENIQRHYLIFSKFGI